MEGAPPHEVTREYLVQAAESMAKHGYYFAMDEKSSNRPVGEVCLQWMNLDRGKRGDEKVMRMPIGIWDRTLWRRGYGKEAASCLARYAFETLAIDRLCAMDVDANNEHSRGLWESLGLRVVRELDEGRTLDYEITAATWNARPSIEAPERSS
jgi:RimJ/RimL family protein N-acetyltransferase